jgi:hypothetical protein
MELPMAGRRTRTRVAVTITITKGDGWREYLEELPGPKMLPVGKAQVGDDLKGALVLDVDEAKYVLIDKTGSRHDVDYASVRDALYGASD